MENWRYKVKPYLQSCFLLTIPVMVWNAFLTDKLPQPFQPEIFSTNIPSWLTIGEQVSRLLIFALTLCMPLSITSKSQQKGLGIYLFGLLIYFTSWLALIYWPQSAWSNSYIGFFAPAYTPLLWLGGIALIGDKFYFNLPYSRWIFCSVCILFLVCHNLHTWIVYYRIH